jgi:hypothetical protein
MVEIVKAYQHDFDEVYPLLQKFNNPYIKKNDWEKIFTSNWKSDDGSCGFILKDGDKVKGFHGLLFSNRTFNSEQIPFANMTSWIVDEDYRKYSLGLLMEILRMKDYTLTNLTPGIKIDQILEKSGFSIFEDKYILYPPFSIPTKTEVLFDDDIPNDKYDSINADIFSDHKVPGIDCGYVEKDNNCCLFIGKRIYKKKLPFFRINYLSNPELFKSIMIPLANKLCLKYRTSALLIPSGIIQGFKLKTSVEVKLPHPMYFKSESIDAGRIDSLYSELMLLNV